MQITHKQKHHGEGFHCNKYNICLAAEGYLTEKKLCLRKTGQGVPYRWGAAILGQRNNSVPVPILHTQTGTSPLLPSETAKTPQPISGEEKTIASTPL